LNAGDKAEVEGDLEPQVEAVAEEEREEHTLANLFLSFPELFILSL
jgi:hypothetical protein